MARRRVGVLISGRGSNMKALVEACAAADYPAEIVTVLSDRSDAAGLGFAAAAGIPAAAIERSSFPTRAAFETELSSRLRAAGVELICLAGFMRLLSPAFVGEWPDRILNIHPSLLPAFPGLDTHARALAAGVRIAGCTVHFVRAQVDSGPIVVQTAVPVLPGDSADILAARILTAEHRAYPLALRLVAAGRARVAGDTVVIDGFHAGHGALANPEPG